MDKGTLWVCASRFSFVSVGLFGMVDSTCLMRWSKVLCVPSGPKDSACPLSDASDPEVIWMGDGD